MTKFRIYEVNKVGHRMQVAGQSALVMVKGTGK